MNNFIEVDKVAFYEAIGPQDVKVEILPGLYPYTSEFVTPSREVRGRKAGYMPEGSGMPQYRYYLASRPVQAGHNRGD